MQSLSPVELEVRIQGHRKLNPGGLPAREWIEGSELTQKEIAALFDSSQKTISNLCLLLGVQRDLRNARDPDSLMNNMPRLPVRGTQTGRIPDRIKRRQEVVKDCLQLAREGNGLARLGLQVMGIRLIDGRGARAG